MKQLIRWTVLSLIAAVILIGCKASKLGSTTKNEELDMRIKEERNVINAEKMEPQEALTMNERMLAEKGQSRGLLAPLAGNLVSLATSAVKKMIANDRKKYVANYRFGLTDLYFYDQLSNDGHFDPVGMQFSGFKLIRTFTTKTGETDTAMIADFIIDTSNVSEIINNSVFRLRLRSFDLRYAKAKMATNSQKKLNMDFEITFHTSYVNEQGTLFDSVTLGKFYFFLRNAPMDRAQPGHKEFYAKLGDSLLTGRSFIVPRSFGYHRNPGGLMKPGYSQGAYSIQVKVTESSRNNFVTKLVFDNANVMIDAGSEQIKQKLKKL